jgi:hypothetical protein
MLAPALAQSTTWPATCSGVSGFIAGGSTLLPTGATATMTFLGPFVLSMDVTSGLIFNFRDSHDIRIRKLIESIPGNGRKGVHNSPVIFRLKPVFSENLHSFFFKVAQSEVNDFDLFGFFLFNSYP